MTDQWITLLVQVPLVGVFVWYSLTSNAKFIESLDKRDQAFEMRTKALIETMNTNNRMVMDTLARIEATNNAHDDFMRDRVASRTWGAGKRGTEDT